MAFLASAPVLVLRQLSRARLVADRKEFLHIHYYTLMLLGIMEGSGRDIQTAFVHFRVHTVGSAEEPTYLITKLLETIHLYKSATFWCQLYEVKAKAIPETKIRIGGQRYIEVSSLV